VNIADAAALITSHWTGHGLTEPVSLHLCIDVEGRPEARIQVQATGIAPTARLSRAWMDTFTTVTLRVWRPGSGGTVHLDALTTLTGPTGSVPVLVFGGVPFDPAVFPDLEAGQAMPVTCAQLTTWADTATGVAA
jgi:hypothetical protein